MASYSGKVKRDIRRWQAAGLIDAATAGVLAKDIDEHARRGFSLVAVLVMLAALLLAAAVLIFISANWEALPRLVRVGLLFSLMAAGYVGGAVLGSRGRAMFGEAAWVVAAAAFGASIALIGQMYHLSGDERSAILVWCIGTALAALALRSNALSVAAVVLSAIWLAWWTPDAWNASQWTASRFYPVLATGLWALALWTRSAPARHLLLLALILYGVVLYAHADQPWVVVALSAASAAFFVGCVQAPSLARSLLVPEGAAIHGLIGFATGMLILQAEMADEPEFWLSAAAVLAGAVAALLLGGHDSRAVRWFAYLLFAVETGIVYLVTVGTLLGTAGFLLVAALLLGALAFVVTRVERRLRSRPSEGGMR